MIPNQPMYILLEVDKTKPKKEPQIVAAAD
jgi:hypothetical protein